MTNAQTVESRLRLNQPRDHKAQIVVVGAGLVGMSAAIACARLGLQVCLIDAGSEPSDVQQTAGNSSWDHRIYAISPGNADWLEALGIWQYIEQGRICPITGMHISGDNAAQGVELLASSNHIPALGYIVENAQLHKAMSACVRFMEIDCYYNTKLTGIHVENAVAILQFSDGRQIEAGLVIAADGAQSVTRKMLNIGVDSMTYLQEAVVANFHCTDDHMGIARQWFLGDSILAMLPLPGQHYSMVWSTPFADSLLAMSDTALATHVQQTCLRMPLSSGGALEHSQDSFSGKLNTVTSARKFKLMKQTADSICSPCVALVGDAAHMVHPLAGQGANLGFRDVIALAARIKNRPQQQRLGDMRLLRQYERDRKTDMLAMRCLSHGLHGLFQHPSRGVRWMRNMGLNVVNHQSTLKRFLVQQAVR